ncbi:hypothetical protein ABIE89_006869 [Bradyrhizobium niftali]
MEGVGLAVLAAGFWRGIGCLHAIGVPLAGDELVVALLSGIQSIHDPTGKTPALSRRPVNPLSQKYSTLPKFGFVVCIAHPGSSLRGDHVVVIFASRACGGRGSVGRESCGQGGLLSVSPRLGARRAALSGSSRQQVSGSVDRAGKTAAKWRAVRTAKPCGPGRRCYGQALAEAAVASTGAVPVNSAKAREARTNSAPGRARHKPSNHCAGKAE